MQKNGAIKAPFYINYSFLIAANGLSFMALNEGINPADLKEKRDVIRLYSKEVP